MARERLYGLAQREPQAGHIQFAMLGVAVLRCAILQEGAQAIRHRFALLGVTGRRSARRSVERDQPQTIDHLSGLLEPPHVRTTNHEPSVSRYRVRRLLQRTEQHRPGLFEPPIKEVPDANPQKGCGDRITRAEAQRSLEMRDRQVRLPVPQPEPAAAELGLSSRARSLKAMAASRSSPK